VSIRLRVTVTAVLVAAIAVGAADGASFVLLKRYFSQRAAASVRDVAGAAAAATGAGKPLVPSLFANTERPVYVELRAPSGRIVETLGTRPRGLPPARLGIARAAHPEGGRETACEEIAVRDARGRTVLAVTSIAPEVTALRHLFIVNVWVGIVVLVLLAISATLLLKRSLRPLTRIAATADAIAAGRLAERVPPVPSRSELARVSTAINRMLEEIESAFAARDATEQRLRQFLADASHELRSPLTSIRGYAELFRRGAAARPEDLAQAMRAIEAEGERMQRLVEDLLLLARLDHARPLEETDVALDEVVEEAIGAARVADRDRRYGFELHARPIVVRGDRTRLRQVVDNLLANVARHTPPGSAAYVTARVDGTEVVLTVEDDGPGIAAADRERVFDRFYRPHDARERERGGAGLGLSIVRALVAAHGGTLSLRAAEPHGTVFEIRIPAADSGETHRSAPGRAQPELVHFDA
jgi:two-component system OmpR family sensor kinase